MEVIMVTKLGKFLRILRISSNELAKDMSAKLEISPSYLSAIELGKREITDKIVECVENKYELTNDQVKEFREIINSEKKYIKFDTRTSDKKVLNIVREIGTRNDISARKLSLIQNILNGEIEDGTINKLLGITSLEGGD
jgi:transcriptional regulator with XRE-family HTH domain